MLVLGDINIDFLKYNNDVQTESGFWSRAEGRGYKVEGS